MILDLALELGTETIITYNNIIIIYILELMCHLNFIIVYDILQLFTDILIVTHVHLPTCNCPILGAERFALECFRYLLQFACK